MLNRFVTRFAAPAVVLALAAAALTGTAHAEQGNTNPLGNPRVSTGPSIETRPDLTVSNLIAVCEAGQVTIVFDTVNGGWLGTASTSFTYVSIDGQVFSHILEQPLLAGQSRHHSRTTYVSGNVQHTVSVTVDAQHKINEGDESNNTVSVPVAIGYSGCQ